VLRLDMAVRLERFVLTTGQHVFKLFINLLLNRTEDFHELQRFVLPKVIVSHNAIKNYSVLLQLC